MPSLYYKSCNADKRFILLGPPNNRKDDTHFHDISKGLPYCPLLCVSSTVQSVAFRPEQKRCPCKKQGQEKKEVRELAPDHPENLVRGKKLTKPLGPMGARFPTCAMAGVTGGGLFDEDWKVGLGVGVALLSSSSSMNPVGRVATSAALHFRRKYQRRTSPTKPRKTTPPTAPPAMASALGLELWSSGFTIDGV